MKFAIALHTYSLRPEDHGVCRKWYSQGEGEGAQWVLQFERARLMEIEDVLEAYRQVDSPQRKLGIVPME